MAVVRSRRGLDLPLAGTPAGPVEDARATATVALLGADYPGLKPALKVDIGDRVALGQTLFEDKQRPGVRYRRAGRRDRERDSSRRTALSGVGRDQRRCVDRADRVRGRSAGARASRCRIGARAPARGGPLAGTAHASIRARAFSDRQAGGDLRHRNRYAPPRDRARRRDCRPRRGLRLRAAAARGARPQALRLRRRRTSSRCAGGRRRRRIRRARTRVATPAGTSTGCCP